MLLIKQLSDIKKKLKTNGYENDTNQLFIYRIGFKTGYRLAKQHHQEKVRKQLADDSKFESTNQGVKGKGQKKVTIKGKKSKIARFRKKFV